MIAIAVVAAVGVSAFALMSSESGPLPAPVDQEPVSASLMCSCPPSGMPACAKTASISARNESAVG